MNLEITTHATDYVTAPSLADGVRLFLDHRRNAGLSLETLALYTRQLESWMQWRVHHGYGDLLTGVNIDELRSYLTYLQTEHRAHQDNPRRPGSGALLAPATVQSIWRTLRALWNFWIAEEKLLSDMQTTFFLRRRIPKPKVPQRIRPTYDRDMLAALLAAADAQPIREKAARDCAMLLLFYDTGVRVGELCRLEDTDMDYSQLQAIVLGKGDKERYVFWTERANAALQTYLGLRRGETPGPLFRGCNWRNDGNKLTEDSVRGVIDRLALKAGVDLPEGAPVHTLRHTFAHRFLDNGGDGLHLQQLMGHESMTTTQRYVRENPTGLRRIYRKALGE